MGHVKCRLLHAFSFFFHDRTACLHGLCCLCDCEMIICMCTKVGSCHTPIPGPTRLADPNRVRGAIPYTGTLYLNFFF